MESDVFSWLGWFGLSCPVIVRSLSAKYRPDRYRRDKSVMFA